MLRSSLRFLGLTSAAVILMQGSANAAAPCLAPCIFPPWAVPIAVAIAEGVQAARNPEEGVFWRWRRDLSALDPNGPVARVTVVTPYLRIMREAYRRALAGRLMTEAEGRTFLADLVRASGAQFPLSLALNPAPHRRLPPPQGLALMDGAGRPLPVRHVRWHDGDAAAELLYEAAGSELRVLLLRVPGVPQAYRLDLAGME